MTATFPSSMLNAFRTGLLLLFVSYRLLAQSDSSYNSVPHQPVQLDAANPFPLFDDSFYKNQLFLLGESHGFQTPQAVDFTLLRHLNQRVGLRHYLAEVDASQARLLNQYLQTGDTTLLKRVFTRWVKQKAQWGNADFYRKIQRIRALNQTLPNRRQIRFVGIDRIQDNPLAADHLSSLLATVRLSNDDRAVVDTLLAQLRSSRPDSIVGATALPLLDRFKADSAAYQRLLKSTYTETRQLLTNIGWLRTIPSREATLFANFAQLLPGLNGEKLYGLWGFFHVLQEKPVNSGKPLACRIRESNLYLHDKIVSITFAYLDSFMMSPSSYLPIEARTPGQRFSPVSLFNNDGKMMHTEGIDVMRALTRPRSVTLFALDRPGSFARTTPLRIRYSSAMAQRIEFNPALPMTAYFQYVMLVRDSPMTEPLAN
ncbi:erythromycin esterase family protein [Spirosoma oryzae]|nr:erythromycin esterase family protein [Spirosoma oryzae]